ncbi:MAG: SH3 domain-containing protein [Caldilineaceae bacterium]
MQQTRLPLFPFFTIVLLLLIFGIVYNLGYRRGQYAITQAELTTEAQRAAVSFPTFTPTPLPPTPTATPTITSTPTPTLSPTPTRTPTATTTPRSAEEWGQRYVTLAADWLNGLSPFDFSEERAAEAVRRAAQDQGLLFVPASYLLLSTEPWAALAMPRTADNRVLPAIFWREPNAGNQIRSQLLLGLFKRNGGATDYENLLAGISHGLLRFDEQGRGQMLLIERPGAKVTLLAYVFSQPTAAADFELRWRSDQEALWALQSLGSEVTLQEREDRLLPDLEITAPIGRNRALRNRIGAADLLVEQTPFARQWVATTWSLVYANELQEGAPAVAAGYRLASAELRNTPLSTLAQMLALLQSGNVNNATNYIARVDLLQRMFDLTLGDPAVWMALYLDDNNQPILDNRITDQLRLFDNSNRERTFDLRFEEEDAGDYRIAAIEQAAPYSTDLVTPAPHSAAGAAVATNLRTATSNTVTPALATVPEEVIAAATQVQSSNDAILVPSLTPVDTATATGTTTDTPTPAPTPTPSDTPTATATPTPSATPTATDTATPTPTPLPIPEIPPEQPAPVTGVTFVTEPARLRGAPGTDTIVISAVENSIPVDVFGITEAGDWLLIRADGVLGWMFRDLIILNDDPALLPRYHADGTPLIPPTPGPTALSDAPAADAPATATPLVTPAIGQPVSQEVTTANVPAPAADEIGMTVLGDQIPANPLAPITVRSADGAERTLRVDNAAIELWGGLVGQAADAWIPAPTQLLWGGAQLYVTGSPAADNPNTWVADRIRIFAAPAMTRVQPVNNSALANAVTNRTFMALLGSRAAPGVYLLEKSGTVQPLWADESNAAWVSGDIEGGFFLQTPDQPLGINRLTWLRTDGSGLQITAQPFHQLQGVAGDLYGGLWWIETPETSLEQWQLWHYAPQAQRVELWLQRDDSDFGVEGAAQARTPVLLAERPLWNDGIVNGAVLLVDTRATQSQEPYQGLFQLTVRLGPDQRGTIDEQPRLLLAPNDYLGPVRVSPQQDRIAYLFYDAAQPSLTAGAVRPPNTVRLLTLAGPNLDTIRPIYANENEAEFLAPTLAWLQPNRLTAVRSRFAQNSALATTQFGLVDLRLPAIEQAGNGAILSNSYALPGRRELLDTSPCLQDESYLLILKNEAGNLELARWGGTAPPQPIFGLPPTLTRTLLCLQSEPSN